MSVVRHRRRGAMYVMVLMVGTLISTVALASLSIARVTQRWTAMSNRASSARDLALAAIAAAQQEMVTNVSWRTQYTHDAWSTERILGDGKIRWKFAEPTQGSLTADLHAPVRVYGRGTLDDAVRTYSVMVRPEPAPANLLDNPGFEQGTLHWICTGSCTLSSWSSAPHSGSYSIIVENRLLSSDGPSQDVTARVANGAAFAAEAWVRSYGLALLIQPVLTVTSTTGTQQFSGVSLLAGTSWVKVTANLEPAWTGTLLEARFSVLSTSLLGGFIVDDVRFSAQPSMVPYLRVPGSFRQEIGP